MLEYFLLILVCQLIGEAIVNTTQIPFPGPVIGMLLLFGFLLTRGSVPTGLVHVASGLLNHLSLLFVPAGVGVILHLKLLSDDALPLTIAMISSTLLTIGITGLVMSRLNNRMDHGQKVTADPGDS